MIEKCKNIAGKLRHGQHRSIGNGGKATNGKVLAELRLPMPAQVRDNGAYPGQVLSHGTPIFLIEWCGMQKSTGEEESEHSQNSDHRHIPAVGLRECEADPGNLAAGVRADKWTPRSPARDWLTRRNDRAAIRAEPRASRQPGAALGAIYRHGQSSSGKPN